MNNKKNINVLLVVAHPDDETLWAGGTILSHPTWKWTIISLTRGSDKDRSENFSKALNILGAKGQMGDMDDGPGQTPLDIEEVKKTILSLLDEKAYDLVITHHPAGEYTRHLRHEETSRAVIHLWQEGKIESNELWFFAYEDGGRSYFPKAKKELASPTVLPDAVWKRKYDIINKTYGFKENSWEAQTTPGVESFIKVRDPAAAVNLMEQYTP